MEYCNNLDLKDIVYFCDFDQVWKTEQWKEIPNYEGLYQVSDLGRVKSFKCNKVKLLKPGTNKHGYKLVVLSKERRRDSVKVNQLVAMAFLNHKRCGLKIVVDHINNIKKDNRLSNLQLTTNRENCTKDTTNRSGARGVTITPSGKYASKYQINGKTKHIGTFVNIDLAKEAYLNAVNNIPNKH